MYTTKNWIQSSSDFPIKASKAPDSEERDISVNSLNHEEILLSVGADFFTYNQTDDKWSRCFDGLKKHDSQSNMSTNRRKVAVDAVHGKMYILALHQGILLMVDMKSTKVQTYGAVTNGGHLHSCLLNVDGAIHSIGGTGNAKHQVWNASSKRFETVYDFRNMYDEYDESNLYIDELRRCCVVYIASRRCLLLIGAQKKFDWPLSHIYEYSLDTKQWKVWNKRIRFPYVCSGAIVVRGDRYVICVAYDNIYVLDVEKRTLKQSNIPCPYNENCVIAKTGTWDVLVYGYVNQMPLKRGNLVPAEIVKLIGQYCNVEMLHWICTGGPTNHCMIPIDTILESVN